MSISVNFPISVNRNSCFLSPFELKIGSKNEILVNVNLPLFSVSFCALCNKKLACPRNIPKHSSRNDLCSLCSFPIREKLHRQFFLGQTDQKLQRSSEPLFWTEFRYTQILRGRIDDSQGVVFCSSRHLFTEILFRTLWLTLIGKLTLIDTKRYFKCYWLLVDFHSDNATFVKKFVLCEKDYKKKRI